MKNQLRKPQKGFTIIEVVIVLAIAGLILGIVFLAVPALQRSTRNTQRKNDAAHLSGLINEWEGNHPGVALTKLDGTAGPDVHSENFSIITAPDTSTAVGAWSADIGGTADNSVKVFNKAKCANGNAAASSSSQRDYVVEIALEPDSSAIICID